MMVPVFYDVQRRKTKVWAFLGWRTTPVDVEYRVPPTVLAVEPSAGGRAAVGDPPPVLFSGDRYEFAVPVMAEVYVSRLLDRDEFRRHCDRTRPGTPSWRTLPDRRRQRTLRSTTCNAASVAKVTAGDVGRRGGTAQRISRLVHGAAFARSSSCRRGRPGTATPCGGSRRQEHPAVEDREGVRAADGHRPPAGGAVPLISWTSGNSV